MVAALQAVVEAVFPVAVGVDHLLRTVLFRQAGESAVPFQDAGGGIVQEHDEVGKPVLFRSLEGGLQAGSFALHQLLCPGFLLLVPADYPPAPQVKGAFESVALCADESAVPAGSVVVLEEEELPGV